MKIAGITWWRGNYGSILQAYALQYIMEEFGVDYEILDQYGETVSGNHFIEHLRVLGIRKTIKKIIWRFGFTDIKHRNQILNDFVSKRLNITRKTYSKVNISEAIRDFDGFVCGSDQIWNPSLTDFDSLYWLQFVPDNNLKFSYAPSIGMKNLSDSQKEKIRLYMKSFDSISCREESGTRLLNSFLEKECYTVLDPTLLLNQIEWDEKLESYQIPDKYILVYLLRASDKERKWIEKFARYKGYKIACFPFLETDYIEKYDKVFGDYRIFDANPLQFISLIKNAEFVFSDSFHCSVFSILYHKEFWIFPKIGATQLTRLEELVKSLMIEDRMINTEMNISQLKPVNYANLENILEDKRKYSLNYIRKVIEPYGNIKKGFGVKNESDNYHSIL